jgi:hypothetical protein
MNKRVSDFVQTVATGRSFSLRDNAHDKMRLGLALQ